MIYNYNRSLKVFVLHFSVLLSLIPGITFTQLVTNGDFESSNIGIVDSSGIEGWSIIVENDVIPSPIFEIVSDTVNHGSRALKVLVQGTGANQWNIQMVADSVPVVQGATYIFSAWAKAEKPGAKLNFTVGKLSYSEIGAIRPANLTTQWQEYTMQFKVQDNIAYVRVPIHFNYTENIGNDVYVDNVQITDINFGKAPVIAEAESGVAGSNFLVQQDDDVTYVTTNTNFTGAASPEDTNRVITYQVKFQDSGYYNLFARVRVGPGEFDDDSFFYGSDFGENEVAVAEDWMLVNGLGSAGFVNPSDYVDGPGIVGTEIWKWINVTKNGYQSSAGVPFYVSDDSLSKTFQIASREDGLDFDKIAFGKADLFYTVDDLDNELPGSATLDDSSYVYPGPPLAEGHTKFLGCGFASSVSEGFANFWNQLTPGNSGKWESVGTSPDSTNWNWRELDYAYNYAKENDIPFKNHTLIWGEQQPDWINDFNPADQLTYIETWIRMVGKRYPDIDMIDVVNEPLPNHNPPDGISGSANYKEALGGNGVTGWDWVIKSFELARKYMPNTELHLNDYSILNSTSSTTAYLQIINLLKDRGLIDGIGVQGHRFSLERANPVTIKNNLDRLAATGLPIYVSELDLGNIGNTGDPDDQQQLTLYQKIFPVLWEHPGVKGITLWGYLQGQMWQQTCFLVRYDDTWRPAMEWLAQYLQDNLTNVDEVESSFPVQYSLNQNFPNPFNPETCIQYFLTSHQHVTLKVYNILGNEVMTLVDEQKQAGTYTVTFDASQLSNGTYFYQLQAGEFIDTKKFVLLK